MPDFSFTFRPYLRANLTVVGPFDLSRGKSHTLQVQEVPKVWLEICPDCLRSATCPRFCELSVKFSRCLTTVHTICHFSKSPGFNLRDQMKIEHVYRYMSCRHTKSPIHTHLWHLLDLQSKKRRLTSPCCGGGETVDKHGQHILPRCPRGSMRGYHPKHMIDRQAATRANDESYVCDDNDVSMPAVLPTPTPGPTHCTSQYLGRLKRGARRGHISCLPVAPGPTHLGRHHERGPKHVIAFNCAVSG